MASEEPRIWREEGRSGQTPRGAEEAERPAEAAPGRRRAELDKAILKASRRSTPTPAFCPFSVARSAEDAVAEMTAAGLRWSRPGRPRFETGREKVRTGSAALPWSSYRSPPRRRPRSGDRSARPGQDSRADVPRSREPMARPGPCPVCDRRRGRWCDCAEGAGPAHAQRPGGSSSPFHHPGHPRG